MKKNDDKIKMYRGIVWRSRSELSKKLGRNVTYVSALLLRHPEMSEQDVIDRHFGKAHGGLTWKTHVELSIKLGKCPSYVHATLKQHKGMTEEDLIDMTKSKSYRGIVWRNRHDLQLQIGGDCYLYLKNNPDKTEQDYIDHRIGKVKHGEGSYRDITWVNWYDLSTKLGKCESYVGIWMNCNKGKTIEECIDYTLGEHL